jgi:hypothetical protein
MKFRSRDRKAQAGKSPDGVPAGAGAPSEEPPAEPAAPEQVVVPESPVVREEPKEPEIVPAPVLQAPKGDRDECPNCGAEVEKGSKFCTQCAAPLTEEAGAGMADAEGPVPDTGKRLSRRKRIEGPVEPWAATTGERVSRMPRWVKVGIPLVIIVILAVLVTLFVLAGTHSQQAAISQYVSKLKSGNYKQAYEMLTHPGGRFSSEEYFVMWQENTTDHLGRLDSYAIAERKTENKLFGKLIKPAPTTGTRYVVTMRYKDKTFDVNMTVEEAGGSWPVQKWKLKLSDSTARLLVSPLGSTVYVDGLLAGTARPNQDLEDALQLRHFPKDIDGAVDYAKKVVKTGQYLIDEFRRMASSLQAVTESAQSVVNRFGASGFSWSDLLDAANSTAQQSKLFGQDVARTAVHIFWIFGGGDDGSTRANLTRVQSEADARNLPEGWHEVSAKLPGATSDSKEFIAPQDVELSLEPTPATQKALKDTMNRYYNVVTIALSTLNTAVLKTAAAGPALVQVTNRVLDLMGKGQRVVAQLTNLRFDNIKLLNESVATLEANETWNYTTFQGSTAVSSQVGQKVKMLYTLEQQGGGLWKVIEQKQI